LLLQVGRLVNFKLSVGLLILIPFTLSHRYSSLRVFSSVPGQAEVLSGGDATGRWLRRGAGFISVNTSVVSCPIVASGSSASDLAGRIWGGSSSIYFAVVLRWQELRRVEELGAGISDNKAAVSSLALPHPSCGGGELGFFFLVELQRLKLAEKFLVA
jgi:hypothetical protein